MTAPKPAKKAAPKPTPPKLIDLARWLFILSAVVGTGRFLYQLSDREMLIRELRVQQPALGQDELDAAATGGVVFGLLMAFALVLGYTLLANRMASGRNWARVVLTVVAVAGIFFGAVRLIAVGSGVAAAFGLVVGPVDLVLSVITMIIDTVAVVLMYLSSVSGYFRSVRSVSVKPPQVANGL